MMERWEQFQGVYVHTPFCLQKCLYCDFPSYAGFTEAVRQQYVDALCREIKTRSLQRELPVAENATVYFGGGTPTVLSVGQIQNIVSCLKEYGWWKEPAEATIEANPGTVDAEKLKALREIGFERISLGVQSLQNNEYVRHSLPDGGVFPRHNESDFADEPVAHFCVQSDSGRRNADGTVGCVRTGYFAG